MVCVSVIVSVVYETPGVLSCRLNHISGTKVTESIKTNVYEFGNTKNRQESFIRASGLTRICFYVEGARNLPNTSYLFPAKMYRVGNVLLF
jgi:hypothetical protein